MNNQEHKLAIVGEMAVHVLHCYIIYMYSSPPLIRTPLLPQNSVLIREVSFAEREHHMHSQYLLSKICVLYRGVSFLKCPLREGPLYK